MPAGATVSKLTYEEYLLFPEDGRLHELVEGSHCVTPAPTPRHQFILSNLHVALGRHVLEHDLGRVAGAPFDVVLSDADVVQPDLFFLSHERLDRLRETRLDGAPDLVVEVVSESTRQRDEILKRRLYEQHGVQEYWVIDPALTSIKIFRRQSAGFGDRVELSAEAGESLTTPLLPGFELALARLFDVP